MFRFSFVSDGMSTECDVRWVVGMIIVKVKNGDFCFIGVRTESPPCEIFNYCSEILNPALV